MKIETTRFGAVEIEPQDVLDFPNGLLGLEDCRQWVLLADTENEALGWLQSATQAQYAFAVVCPRRFVPDYQVRISRGELTPLLLADMREAQVLAIVGKGERGITLNLKAPVVINLERRLGRQVITNGDMPVSYELTSQPAPLRKIA
jgi:flagellar assembly factor FliW